jgi:hypothetical protein
MKLFTRVKHLHSSDSLWRTLRKCPSNGGVHLIMDAILLSGFRTKSGQSYSTLCEYHPTELCYLVVLFFHGSGIGEVEALGESVFPCLV